VAVSVVQDGPPWNPVTPVFRAAVTATGVLLRTLARVALPLAVLASLYWAVATFDEEQNLSQEVGGYRSGPLAAGLLAFAASTEFIGRRFLSRRRKTVLFLRRFGYGDATRAVLAATELMGRNWRVVTLDDAAIAPLEAAPHLRRSLSGLTTSAETVNAGRRLAGKALARLYRLTLLAGFLFILLARPSSEDWLGWLASAGTTVDLILEFARTLVPILVGMAIIWAFAVLTMRLVRVGSRSLDVAQEYRYLQVRSEADIQRTCQKVDSRERAVFNPRLMVVKVDFAVWQETVTMLAGVCDAMLFDVSKPTDNLLWEMETLVSAHADLCVFIGQLDVLRPFFVDGSSAEGHGATRSRTVTVSRDSPLGRVEQLLDGRAVIGYRSDAKGLRRFRRALRAELEALPN
jgi:hypothetical protein